MKRSHILLFAAFTALISSCGDAPEVVPGNDDISQNDEQEASLEKPIEVTWDELNKRDFEDGQVVTLNSFVPPISTRFIFFGEELSLKFFERRNQISGFHLSVDIPLGEGKNQIRPLPDEFNPVKDVVIYTEDGDTVIVGDYVQLTGVWSNSSEDNFDQLQLTEIKRVEQKMNQKVVEDAKELTDALIESEADNIYSYIEGTVDLNMYMTSFDQLDYTVNSEQSSNKYISTVSILIGDRPSTMNELIENFTASDFVIRDHTGNEIAASGKTFRLYGTFEKSEYFTYQKGIFHVEEMVLLKAMKENDEDLN